MSAATVWKMEKIFNDELMAVCRQNGVPCLDLAAVIPHDEEYFYDAAHFTEKGAALVADTVRQFIVDQKIIDGALPKQR